MHLLALASAAVLAAGVSANTYNFNSTCPDSPENRVRVFNRCPYDVYLWSIMNQPGCPSGEATVVPSGGFYCESMRDPIDNKGVSIKVSKSPTCSPKQLLQLEYYLERVKDKYKSNYLDVSYVDCPGNDCDCPTKKEGYYLKAGNTVKSQDLAQDNMAKEGNHICPILSCNDAEECATMSYINWDDPQTKSCILDAPLDFYMCGGDAPGEEVSAPSSAPSSSSSSEKDTPSSKKSKPSPTQEAQIQAAAITPPPAPEEKRPLNVKTEIVFTTKVVYVNAKKRHDHMRHHEHFRA